MIRIIHVVGARPQFIKLSPLYNRMKKNNFSQEILHTGQHYDRQMSDVFFESLNIPKPDYNLSINNLSHGAMTGRMIEQIENIFTSKTYDYVILYGDTNSTLAGAISAKKLGLRIIHVESGVRNNDMSMPEEINRIITDRVSNLLFCSTNLNYENLKQEGYSSFDCNFYNVGDLMQELFYKNFNIKESVKNQILFTCHRAENIKQNNLTQIFLALNSLSKNFEIIFPAHPATHNAIKLFNIKCDFEIKNPMTYSEIINEMIKSKFVITDSGGLIKESYWCSKPSLSIMSKPVWEELISNKVSLNSLPVKDEILNNFKSLIGIKHFPENIFGDGNASKKIVHYITQDFQKI